MQQTAAGRKWGVGGGNAPGVPGAAGGGAAGWGDTPDDAVWAQSGVAGSAGWGDEPPGGGGANSEIGTWRPSEPNSSWVQGPPRSGNEIIVDTKDKEAWPSIGDQSEEAGAGDNNDDAASQKSGSVISSSSQSGREPDVDQKPRDGASNNNGWGQITGPETSEWNKDAGTSAWSQSSLPQRSTASSNSNTLGVSGWGSPSASPTLNNPGAGQGLPGQEGQESTAASGPSPGQTPTSAGPGLWPGMDSKPGEQAPQTGGAQPGAAAGQAPANNSPWNISDNSGGAGAFPAGSRPAGLGGQWGAAVTSSAGPTANAAGWGRPIAGGTNASDPANIRSWQQPSPVPSPNDIPAQSLAGQASIPSGPAGWNQLNSLDKGANNATTTAAATGWGQLPTAPTNQPPQWGTTPPLNPAKTMPGSWAQAAGKGLQSVPSTQQTPGTNPIATSPHDQTIPVNAVQGWGLKPVRQDASWDTEISPRSKRREIESANSNVWNSQVNNGTSLWENAKAAQTKPTQIMAKSGPITQTSWNGDLNKPGWGDEQWNKQPNPDPTSWNGQAPPNPSDPNSWKNDPTRGPPPMWPGGGQARTTSSSSWDGPAPTPANNGPAWPDQGQNRPGAPAGWTGPPDRSQSWDGPTQPVPGNAPSPGWDNRTALPPSKWTSAKASEIKPTGWDQAHMAMAPPAAPRQPVVSQDDGTAFWGDPSVHKQPPGWGAGSNPTTPQTPTPRMKPDGSGPWDRPPPNVNVKDPAMWANSGPPNGESAGLQSRSQDSNTWVGSGSGSNQWNKPKPSFDSMGSSWGTPIDMWNKPTEPGQQWPDDVSVWGDDNNEMQENASWSSARDWNKKKNMTSTMMPPAMSSASMGPPPGPPGGRNVPQMRIKLLQQLMDMGFKKEDAQRALIDHNLNLESAIADLMTNAGAELEAQKVLKARGMHNDMHNDKFGPNLGMQNTQMALHNQQAMANALKQSGAGGGAPSLATSSLGVNNSSISPSIQQKLLQQSLLEQNAGALRGNPAAAQSVQQQQKLMAQQQQQQLLVQQLRMAVQHGLISPQTLNQPFSPQMLNVLQQMLQGQTVLQRLQTQQQMIIQQNKNPVTQRQQMEQVRIMTKKMEQQIHGLQQQLGQAQQQAFNPNPMNKEDLSEFSNLTMKEPSPPTNPAQPPSQPSAQQPSQPQTSRLNQWKLPSPDKTGISEEEKAKLGHSASANNLQSQANGQQSKFEFTRSLSIGGDSTWSPGTSTSTSSDWPSSTTATSGTVTSSAAASSAGSTNTQAATSTAQAGQQNGSPTEDVNRSSPASNSSQNAATFSLNDMIPEFVPGKPWQGVANKNIEDDPHITPGSVSRSLSVNTIKDDYLNTFTNKALAANADTGNSVPSNWSSVRPPQPKWQPPNSATSPGMGGDMWGGKMGTRPPPGIPNKATWSSGAPGAQQQMTRSGGISWAGDKSAFSAVPSPTSSYDPRSAGSSILILKNLTPQTDVQTLQTLCMQNGSVVGFQANQSLALVEYSTREDAIRAQKVLNGSVFGNTTIQAELMKGEPQPQPPQQQQALWQHQQQQQVGFGQQVPNYRNAPPPKADMGTGHWNGAATGFHGAGMWSSGAANNSSTWGGGLLHNDLLGGETM